MAYTISKVIGGFEINDGPLGERTIYATEAQAKRRVRDLNKKAGAKASAPTETYTAPAGSNSPKTEKAKQIGQALATALSKLPKLALAKASEAVKKSTPAKAKPTPAKKPTTVAEAIKAAPSAIAKTVAKTAVADLKKSTAVKVPDTKPVLCKAVPKQIEGKPVSNYRGVRLAIEAGGPEVGLAHGLALGLPHSQVKAYVKELIVLIEKAKNKPAKGTAPKASAKANGEFAPHFRYTSRDQATKAAIAQARRCGLAEAHFHVLEEGTKFAIAPIHHANRGKVPQFEKGDTVMDTIIADSRAVILETGPQQCVVKYEDAKRGEQAIPNVYLYKIDSKPAVAPKAVKPAVKKTAKAKAK
jgi:hypothetical protein